MLRLLLPFLLLPSLSRADSCDDLLAQIDTKVRAGGATNYTLLTVDTDAAETGRVVGSCGMGKKKIVYATVGPKRGAPPPIGATLGNPSGLAAKVNRPGVMTECKPGYAGADCGVREAASTSSTAKIAPPATP